jgi:hypothetical protein
MSTTTMASVYRLPMFRRLEPAMDRGLRVAGIVGVVVLAAVYLAPQRAPEMLTVDQVPERLAKLILEPPKPVAQVKLPDPPRVVLETPPAPKVVAKPEPVAPRRETTPKLAEDRGQVGRERAQQEVAKLQEVTSSLDKVLADVTASLASTDDGSTQPRAEPRRRTRSGRSSVESGSAPAMPQVTAAGAGAAISGARIEIASLAEAGLPAPEATRADGSRAGSGEIRSDASLLAVVRKYAPGIQFCYENELKKSPGLGGKLVVAITVAASGRVEGATIAQDTTKTPGPNGR